jgi:hypothetical protein
LSLSILAYCVFGWYLHVPFSLLRQVLRLLGQEATGTLPTKPEGPAEAKLTILGILTVDEVSTVKPTISFRTKRMSLYIVFIINRITPAMQHRTECSDEICTT